MTIFNRATWYIDVTCDLLRAADLTKQRDPDNGQQSLLFQIDYPEIVEGIAPRHRFMAAYEQKVEPPDRKWQYLLFAAEPYETIAFKVPSREVDKDPKKLWSHWNRETKQVGNGRPVAFQSLKEKTHY
uniref:Splicing factor 3A subunit 2 n=1 Tax=Magallana gigas TaxID=29159 RepID=K1QW67_MAGGI